MGYDLKKAEQIWNTVIRIPAGRVASYGLIADLAGLPGRARMVGRSMQQAPTEMGLPWYRVIRSNGQLAFTPGSAMAQKQKGLLQEEGVIVLDNRVDMGRFGWTPELHELMQMDY